MICSVLKDRGGTTYKRSALPCVFPVEQNHRFAEANRPASPPPQIWTVIIVKEVCDLAVSPDWVRRHSWTDCGLAKALPSSYKQLLRVRYVVGITASRGMVGHG